MSCHVYLNIVSLNNQPCQARPTLVDINSNEALFYPFTASVDKCGGSCNIIDDPYAWVCVPNKVIKQDDKVVSIGNIWLRWQFYF